MASPDNSSIAQPTSIEAPGSANSPVFVAKTKEERRIASLKAQIVENKKKLEEMNEKLLNVNKELGPVDAKAIVKKHIHLLHQYNDIKDIGTGLLGMIAEKKGLRIKDMYEEYGVSEKD